MLTKSLFLYLPNVSRGTFFLSVVALVTIGSGPTENFTPELLFTCFPSNTTLTPPSVDRLFLAAPSTERAGVRHVMLVGNFLRRRRNMEIILDTDRPSHFFHPFYLFHKAPPPTGKA